jgi:hypothetical protein
MRIILLIFLLFFQIQHTHCMTLASAIPDVLALTPSIALRCANNVVANNIPELICLPTPNLQTSSILISFGFQCLGLTLEFITREIQYPNIKLNANMMNVKNNSPIQIISEWRTFLKFLEITILLTTHTCVFYYNGSLITKKNLSGTGIYLILTQFSSSLLFVLSKIIVERNNFAFDSK